MVGLRKPLPSNASIVAGLVCGVLSVFCTPSAEGQALAGSSPPSIVDSPAGSSSPSIVDSPAGSSPPSALDRAAVVQAPETTKEGPPDSDMSDGQPIAAQDMPVEPGFGAGGATPPVPAVLADEPADAFPSFEFSARLIAGADLRRAHPGAEQFADTHKQSFFLKQARVKLTGRLMKAVRLTLSADLDSDPPVRSAFVNIRVKRALQFRVGRFKRPLSRLELTGIGRLPMLDRGLFNAALIERAGWGDRALGVMLHGKFKALGLKYQAAVTNAAPTVGEKLLERLKGVDVIGRLQWKVVSGLSLGVNGGHKVLQTRVNGPKLHFNAIGADAALKAGGFKLLVESIMAENPYAPAPPAEPDRSPWALTVTSVLQYDWALDQRLTVQPAAQFEWLDTDTDVSQDESIRVVLGVNWLWSDSLRLMPQVELVRPLGAVSVRSQLASETYSIALSLQL